MLAAILFDFDGTIAETERLGHRVAYNAAFSQFGLDWEWGDALYGELLAIGGGKERIAHYLDHYRSDGDTIDDRAALIAALHQTKQLVFGTLAASLAFRPGVHRLIREARAGGVRLGIVTTAALAGVQALIAPDPELRDAFDLIAAGDIVPHKKPAPDIYLYALKRLDVAAGDCVAVEDSTIGLQAARAAGIATLVTVSDYTRGEDFRGASAVLSDLGEPPTAAQTLAGPAPPNGYVDLTYLRSLLSKFA